LRAASSATMAWLSRSGIAFAVRGCPQWCDAHGGSGGHGAQSIAEAAEELRSGRVAATLDTRFARDGSSVAASAFSAPLRALRLAFLRVLRFLQRPEIGRTLGFHPSSNSARRISVTTRP
jgi:hypothetical protein